MNAIYALAAKILKDAAVRFAKGDEPDEGEWRGKYSLKQIGVAERKFDTVAIYRCEIDPQDPLRLFHRKSRLEFSFVQTVFHSDLGSIPILAQEIKQLRLKPDAFPRSYLIHDEIYSKAAVRVRDPAKIAPWTIMPAKRADADVLLHIGLSCEGATRAETAAIYRAVQLGGFVAWNKHRQRERESARSMKATVAKIQAEEARESHPTAPHGAP